MIKNLIPFISRFGFLASITVAFVTKNLVISIVAAVLIYIACTALEAVLQKKALGQTPEIVNIFSMLGRMDLKGKITNILMIIIPLIIYILSVILVWAVLR